MKAYQDIYECPIDPYHWVEERKSFKYLVKEGEYDPKKHDSILAEIYQNMQYQKIDEFGVSNEFELYFYKLRDVHKKELQVLKGDRSAITFLNIYRSELKLIEKRLEGDKKEDVRKSNARLHRAIQSKFNRDSHKLTVFEFYNDVYDLMDIQKEEEMREYSRQKMRHHG